MNEEQVKTRKPKLPQVSTSISQDIYDQIKELADRDRRSVSSMTAILLERAFKDKNRKR